MGRKETTMKKLSLFVVIILLFGLLPNGIFALAQVEQEPLAMEDVAQTDAFSTTPMIVAGGSWTVALASDGTAWTWGRISPAGVGEIISTTPVQVQNLSNVTFIAVGHQNSFALTSDGTVYTFRGQTFDGTTTRHDAPIRVESLRGVVAIAAGLHHSLALTNDGYVLAWGSNANGELGNGESGHGSFSATPVNVLNLTNVVAIAAGANHSLALRDDNTVWAWGNNHWGQLGNDSTVSSNVPVPVEILNGVTAIASGGVNSHHSVALNRNGFVYAWGNNGDGQLGDGLGGWGNRRTIPARVRISVDLPLDEGVSIAAGGHHTLALRSDGTAWEWGAYWLLPIENSPTQVQNMDNVTAITANSSHTIALRSNGEVWAWGNHGAGQLGIGGNTSGTSRMPRQVVGYNGVGFLNLGENTPPPPPIPPEPPPVTLPGNDRLAELFAASAFSYNHELARFAAVLSEAAYNYEYLRRELGRWYMSYVEWWPYFDSGVAVEYTFASRPLVRGGEVYNLIFIVIRGTGSVLEWIDNLIVFSTLGGYHSGFALATSRLQDNLDIYLARYGMLDPARNIFLITGHSRGGAVANLVARNLNSNRQFSFGDNLYTYTFASPRVTRNSGTNLARYRNIFNIINRRDMVPRLPRTAPSKHNPFGSDQWSRFGIDIAVRMPNSSFAPAPHPAHAMVTYQEWLRDSNPDLTYEDFRGISIAEAQNGTVSKLLSWNSPVDIAIYDSQGYLVGEIIDNVAINVEDSEVFVFVSDDVKQAFLPYGDIYTVKMTGTDSGTMTFLVESLDKIPDIPNTVKLFENIALYYGREMTSVIVNVPDIRLLIVKDGRFVGEISEDGTETLFDGSAIISNMNPRIGDVLTGSFEGNIPGTPIFTWRSNDTIVGAGMTYTVNIADLNNVITLEVTFDEGFGTITSRPTAAVSRKVPPPAPAAPTAVLVTCNVVTLAAVTGHEFSMDGVNWQTDNVFDGLMQNTLYTFFQRIAQTADTEASESSPALKVTTENAPAASVNVIVSPSIASVQPGNSQAFTATVVGVNDIDQTVVWTVKGAMAVGTMITSPGALTVDINESATTLVVRATSVVDTNAFGTAVVQITTVPPLSNDATLTSLTISQGTLSPAFSPLIFNYTANVGNAVASVTIYATAAPGATVTGIGAHSLGVGQNTIVLTVTAEDGSIQIYMIVVTRAAAHGDDDNNGNDNVILPPWPPVPPQQQPTAVSVTPPIYGHYLPWAPRYPQQQQFVSDDNDYSVLYVEYDQDVDDDVEFTPIPVPPMPVHFMRLVIGSTVFTRNGVTMENDVAPFIDPAYNRTMVPLRIIAEALGAEVRFNSVTRAVYIAQGGLEISLVIDVPLPDGMGTPVIINDRTFVPARYVSEILGAMVRWDGTNRAVYIYK
ncbi:MAG: stalk domain-containing protein [Firmicutes bacterium]|nr:stalk domain-containing protein [Bacillota bacterium]